MCAGHNRTVLSHITICRLLANGTKKIKLTKAQEQKLAYLQYLFLEPTYAGQVAHKQLCYNKI